MWPCKHSRYDFVDSLILTVIMAVNNYLCNSHRPWPSHKTLIYSTTISGAGQHSIDICQWIRLRVSLRCGPTHPFSVQCWSSVAAHCWFNADKFLRHWTQHYTNTGSALHVAAEPQQKRAIYRILLQCWPYVFDAGPTLKQHWVIVPCLRQKSHYPDNTIHWPNADVMLGHCLWRWANIILTISL